MDVVYMGRGTKKLYTAWTPLSDVPLSMGGLLVLERSHQHDKLNNGYASKDVDEFCENKVGEGYTKMGGGGNIRDGGWLSDNPVKLRNALGGRWLTANYEAGDVLIFSVFTVHTSLDNASNRVRLSTDTRYQRADEPIRRTLDRRRTHWPRRCRQTRQNLFSLAILLIVPESGMIERVSFL
jgi:ectoine hydroxylase-related dioxygenase (phytanoyl-CoA dioxygenase family)